MTTDTYVATLISDPAAPALDDAILRRARRSLFAAQEPYWLDPGVAAEIVFAPGIDSDVRGLSDHLRTVIGRDPVDVVVQRTGPRRKKLFIADMDSTMIGQECVDELADFVGLKAYVAAITERAMRGEIAFEPALRERVALLKGLPVSVVEKVIAERITLTPGGPTLVRTMRKQGALTCLVSGGFTLFTKRIADMIGFEENRGNTLAVAKDGTLEGVVGEPILGRDGKLATLLDLTARLGVGLDDTMAAGDGANDLAMIEMSGLGVAYHAKPAVAAAAPARIDHGDLTALLYMQGYKRDEFVAA
jgi:phosphoserine phosphatase